MNIKEKRLLLSAVSIFKGYDSTYSNVDLYIGDKVVVLKSIDLSILLKLPSFEIPTITHARFFRFDLERFADFLNSAGLINDGSVITANLVSLNSIRFEIQSGSISAANSYSGQLITEQVAKATFKNPERIGAFGQGDVKHLMEAIKFSSSKGKPLNVRDDCSTILIRGNHIYSTDKYFGYKSPKMYSNIDFNFAIPDRLVPLINLDGGGFSILDHDSKFGLKGKNYQVVYPKSIYCEHLDKPFTPSGEMDIVVVDRDELMSSLNDMKQYFDKFSASRITKNLQLCINGSFQVVPKSSDDAVSCSITGFKKFTDDDLNVTTDGTRLMRIIKDINTKQIKLRIPRSNEGLIINDSHCLMSWVDNI